MSGPTRRTPAGLELEFPQSLAVYTTYPEAQRSVDHLADNGFPVQNCMIVGTDLKRIERITGRLTTGRVAMLGAVSGIWLGLFVGLVLVLFSTESALGVLASCTTIGALFGVIWALIGYAGTRGQRDFSSVSAVVATKYEVLVEHKHRADAMALLSKLPGGLPDPFA